MISPVAIIGAQEICGAWVSLTVTVNEQPGPAAVVQLTVVVPTGKNDPEAGRQLTVEHIPLSVGEKFGSSNLTLPPPISKGVLV